MEYNRGSDQPIPGYERAPGLEYLSSRHLSIYTAMNGQLLGTNRWPLARLPMYTVSRRRYNGENLSLSTSSLLENISNIWTAILSKEKPWYDSVWNFEYVLLVKFLLVKRILRLARGIFIRLTSRGLNARDWQDRPWGFTKATFWNLESTHLVSSL